MPALQFDRSAHVYTVGSERIPSVTEVLKDCGIVDYSTMPDATRQKVMERGRLVHQITEWWDQESLDVTSVDDELEGYLRAWVRFREQAEFFPDRIEERVFNDRYRYAGMLDRIGRIGSKRALCLLDIKTGAALPWVAYQTAAYAGCVFNSMAYRRMSVELHEDGTYQVQEFRNADFPEHFNVFAAALTVYRAKRRRS